MIRAWQRNARIRFGHGVNRNGGGSDTKRLVEPNTVASPFSSSLYLSSDADVSLCGMWATDRPVDSHNACQKIESNGAVLQVTYFFCRHQLKP